MQYFKATHIRPPAAGFIPLYFVKYSAYQKLYLVPAEFEILIMTQLHVIHQLLVRGSAFEDNYFFQIELRLKTCLYRGGMTAFVQDHKYKIYFILDQ